MKQFLHIQAKTNKTVSSAARGRRTSQPVQNQRKQRESIPTQLRFSLSRIPIEPQAEISQSSDSGHPLPAFVRQKMEMAFGQDFSDVRIHEGSHVTSIGARAYTQGTDIHFAPGAYQPQSLNGQEVIGHELIHVIQQRRGQVPNNRLISDIPVLEDEAHTGATQVAHGRKVHIEQGRAGGRQPGAGGAPIQMLGEEKEKKKKRQLQQAQRTTLLQPQPQQAQRTTVLQPQPQRAYVESIEPSPQPQEAQRIPEKFSQQQVQYVAGALSQRGQLFPGTGTQQTQPKAPVEIISEQETPLETQLEEGKQPSEAKSQGGYINPVGSEPKSEAKSQGGYINPVGSEPKSEGEKTSKVSSEEKAERMRSAATIEATKQLLDMLDRVSRAQEYPRGGLPIIQVQAETLQKLLAGEVKDPKFKQVQASSMNVLNQLLSAIPKIEKEVEEDPRRWLKARDELVRFQAELLTIKVKSQLGIPL